MTQAGDFGKKHVEGYAADALAGDGDQESIPLTTRCYASIVSLVTCGHPPEPDRLEVVTTHPGFQGSAEQRYCVESIRHDGGLHTEFKK